MRKLTKVLIVLALVMLTSCSLFQKPIATPNIQEYDSGFLRQLEIEVDGVSYHWIYNKSYPAYGKIVCPERDKAIINNSQ